MARTTGPLGSQAASGTLADLLTFGTTKGRGIVRLKPRQKTTRTPLQLSNRAMLRWLTTRWAVDLSDAQRATWLELAAARTVSPFNAYVRFNLDRWARQQAPSKSHPATEADLAGAFFGTQTPQVSGHQVTWRMLPGALNQNWGVMFHRSLITGFTPSRETLIGASLCQTSSVKRYVESDVPSGTWFNKNVTFSALGRTGTTSGQTTAIVA